MTDATNTAEATEAKVELTIEQKIAQLEGRIAKLRQQQLTEQLLSNIERGDKVTIKFGRGEKVRNIDGEVVAVALPNVVVVSEDLESFKVHVRDIIANPTAAERVGPVTAPEEIDPIDGRRPEEAGAADNSADPLENA